ncbi:MAG: class I SAM-dependent methyltransferase [Candidatus Acidiferrum sp.]|jgi:methyltransferase family protein
MNLTKFALEVSQASHYRQRPVAVLRYAYAKWVFRRFRQTSPVRFLQGLGVDVDLALLGFSEWRPRLERVVSEVGREAGGQGGVSFEDGMILYGLARALKPEYIVETGIAAGVSTSFFGAALVENGRGWLHSIDLPLEETSGRALADGSSYAWQKHGVGWAIPGEIRSSLGDRHRVVLQDVRVALPQILRNLPYVDLFFHDDLHTPDHMLWEYEAVWAKLSARGVLVSDDANDGWIRFCAGQGFHGTALHNIDRLCALRKPGSGKVRA